jgi:hypothetical protein
MHYMHVMQSGQRTTIVLDAQSRRAARELAKAYGCSVSEAIRRAIVEQRQRALGLTEDRRRERLEAFRRLVKLFRANDAAAEIARIKQEDEHA